MDRIFYRYTYDNGEMGICFNSSVELGDIEVFKRYKFIVLDDREELVDENGIRCYGLYFKNMSEEFIEIICELMNLTIQQEPGLTVTQVLHSISTIFRRYDISTAINKYLGLFSELAFVKYLNDNGINGLDYYAGSNDELDFHFNDANIEIKYLSKESSSFTTSYRQLDKIKSKETNNYVVFDSVHHRKFGINLNELFNMVNDNSQTMLRVRDSILKLYDEFPSLFDQYKILLEESKFLLVDRSFLPEVNIKEKKTIISASFKIFAFTKDKTNVANYVRELLGGNND